MIRTHYLAAMFALTTFFPSFSILAAEKLVIISPHRKSIQEEFMPKFKEHYKKTYGAEIQIDWLDQGGTSDDIRFVRSKYKNNPKTSNIDIFWGGGATTFIELASDNLLQSYKLPNELKKQIDNETTQEGIKELEEFYIDIVKKRISNPGLVDIYKNLKIINTIYKSNDHN